jgi:hypothetical protein
MVLHSYPVTAGGVGSTASAIQATLEAPAAGSVKVGAAMRVGVESSLVCSITIGIGKRKGFCSSTSWIDSGTPADGVMVLPSYR